VFALTPPSRAHLDFGIFSSFISQLCNSRGHTFVFFYFVLNLCIQFVFFGACDFSAFKIIYYSIEMVRDGYVVYTLEVTYLSALSGRKSVWRTYRRYSQFDDLHSCIVEQCGRIPSLKLPSKKSFSNISPEFIEKRRLELDEYLKVRFHLSVPSTSTLILRDSFRSILNKSISSAVHIMRGIIA
ncbi:unnamed protein product, partial [Hydatigera taeniaeformis]|uniref:PX domain-containing protein n=1 Tax=Hydatigena taeniaeformis TaxID=6205 RepID=A0A0R3WRI8_HYDTA